MKKQIFLALIATLFALQVSAATDHLSYAIGYQLGKGFKQTNFPLHKADFMTGLQAGFTGNTPAVSEEDMKTAITEFQKHVLKNRVAQLKKMGASNLAAGKAFLAKNKTQPGVKTLPNGLQYKVITPGTGNKPTASDKVVVDYQGTLVNGTVFDSSYKRGEPTTFQVNRVIPGWTQGLQMMKEGATWMLYIPANLAYGASGAAPVIPPNATLIFKVHLRKIQK